MRISWLIAVFLAWAVPAAAIPINVAQGKPATITGEIGILTNMCCGWGSPAPAPVASITDGVFLPEGTSWQLNTVWWDETNPGSTDNIVEVDLQGLYSITRVTIQADNNDEYQIFYRDALNSWIFYGTFGAVPGFGMRTQSAAIPPLLTSGFRIDPTGGDLFYSVSEFQAFADIAQPIPEPATLILFGTGLSVLAARRRLKPQ